jgi:hypothetical protein
MYLSQYKAPKPTAFPTRPTRKSATAQPEANVAPTVHDLDVAAAHLRDIQPARGDESRPASFTTTAASNRLTQDLVHLKDPRRFKIRTVRKVTCTCSQPREHKPPQPGTLDRNKAQVSRLRKYRQNLDNFTSMATPTENRVNYGEAQRRRAAAGPPRSPSASVCLAVPSVAGYLQ